MRRVVFVFCWEFRISLVTEEATINSGFDKLSISPVTISALGKAAYLEPTPVQAGLIPRALEGVDVVAQARTGTGKTAAFVIPILEMLKPRRDKTGPQALILVPTRELAVQVRSEVQKLSYGRQVRYVAIYGGKPLRGQIDKLARGVQVVIGTPGRVLDHLSRGSLRLDDIACLVLDEADRMLDIGFRPDIEKIIRRCPRSRQTLLLSATVPPPIQRLAQRYMRHPENLNFSQNDIAVETIEQFYFTVDPTQKFDLLLRLIQREQPKQAIIFCRTRRGTDRVHRRLSKRVESAGCLHGDMQQSARDRVMSSFRQGKIRFLVATDVVGRGIDVTGISHIINYDIPQFCDDYIHRVGRTGRMGREGVAFTFVAPEEGPELTRIEMRIERLLQRDEMDGFEFRSQTPSPESGTGEDRVEEKKPEPPPPLYSRGGRAPKRYRRAL